jgi:RNA polymerase sigma-70 factor (ECF subfamily)
MTEASERDMIGAIARGDRSGMRRLYERYATPLYRFALVRLGEPGAAEDAVQETILAAWRGAAAFRGDSRVATWLFGICRNKVLDLARRREVVAEPANLEVEDPAGRSGGEPGAAVERLEFWEAFGRLGEAEQELILLVFHYGFSQKEVAGMLGVPVGTVKSRTYHARRRLKAALEGKGADVNG